MIFLLLSAIVSMGITAGENDLLWDYSESAPKGSPDNGLTYGSKVDDAAGTNNGLRGVKMNSSGYCYFTKAAVAGKLRLTYGPRSGANEVKLIVSTWEGETPSAETQIAETSGHQDCTTDVVELTAEQNNIYISRHSKSTEGVLTKIEFKENVERSFTDFKIEFRDDPFHVLLPESGELPAGVSVEGTSYNGGQHGVFGGTITVPVDGTVKFTIGACQYSSSLIQVLKDGEEFALLSNAAPCGETSGHFDQFVTWTYLGEAGVLTFVLAGNTYVPYFFAEATELTPCQVIFKDQLGGELGRLDKFEGETLDNFPYGVEDLPAFPDTEKFRGWFYTNGRRAYTDDVINGNTTIQAKVTPIEHATVGSVQTYPFNSEIFYPWDHETVDVKGNCYFHDNTHGWAFHNGEAFTVDVAGNAVVVLSICQYGAEDAIWIPSDADDNLLSPLPAISSADGADAALRYSGPATTLTFTMTNTGGENYLHKVTVYNVEHFIEKDESTGYIIAPSGDAAAFVLALAQAEEGDKIFLPNGIYDLGETVLTTISKNNISIIGQSSEGTIIRNAPDASTESINNTATLRIGKNVKGTYLQDLTIQNALDYYKNDNGRAVALWDQGTQTVCKNVRLLSYQDTYYSNLQGAVKYFEDWEIHGTVDFICGDGSVYFKNNLLYCEKRNKANTGTDALTANNGIASDRGYVFEGCTVKSECPTVSLGRAWNNVPTTTFLNTTVDYSAGEFQFLSTRWTPELMNANAWPKFGEFNTRLADGTVLTPASNVVTFVDGNSGKTTQDIETVLNAEDAAAITMEYTLGEWAAQAKSDAEQAECELQWENLDANATYLAETDGEFVMLLKGSEVMDKLAVYDGVQYTLRKANSRGGFGKRAGEEPSEGVSNIQSENIQSTKMIRDGQVFIQRNGMTYDVLGKVTNF